MVGEKKKTSGKTSSQKSNEAPDKVSVQPSGVKMGAGRKASLKESGKESVKESTKSKVVVRRKAASPPSPASLLQEMARKKEGSKMSGRLTTRTAPSSSPRARAAAGARKEKPSKKGYWQGQMLLASPAIGDQRFERSVIYLCHQGEDGALGLVINKIADKIQFTDVLDHLNIPFASSFERISVHVGGPVESSRGFVLHSPEKMFAGTIELGDLAMTASADILKQIAEGKGPKDYVFLLGYAGWGTGQLDKEIERNAWLHLPFDRDLVFGEDDQDKWSRAMQKLGISPHLLSGVSGNA